MVIIHSPSKRFFVAVGNIINIMTEDLSYDKVSRGLADKESTCNVGDLGLVPGLGRFPEEGNGYPLQYSGLENSTEYIAYGATKSQT